MKTSFAIIAFDFCLPAASQMIESGAPISLKNSSRSVSAFPFRRFYSIAAVLFLRIASSGVVLSTFPKPHAKASLRISLESGGSISLRSKY